MHVNKMVVKLNLGRLLQNFQAPDLSTQGSANSERLTRSLQKFVDRGV